MRLLQVKEFNQEKSAEYDEAVKGFEFGKGGFPYRPMFVYVNEDTGADKQKGWVYSDKGGSHWFSNKEEALSFIERINLK